MGRWGEELFAGDMDQDDISDISADAGIELYRYKIEDGGEGKGLEATRAHLNNGVLNRLFEKYATYKAVFWFGCVSKELRYILLGALAMRVGANISAQQMEILRDSYQKCRVSPKYTLAIFDSNFRRPAYVQFETAVECYPNDGKPWDFDVAHCKGPSCGKTEGVMKGKLKICAKCRIVFYCRKECQAADWERHKTYCTEPLENPRPMLLNV